MRYFDQSFSSSSPILVMPPSQPSFSNTNHPAFTSPFGHGNNPQTPSSSWSIASQPPPVSTPCSAAGRKRSRDEAAPNLADDGYFAVQTPVAQPEPENEDEWEYGEGMTLIKPNVGYIMEASSQTGTWAEEKAEEKMQPITPTERPCLRANKSQRLNSSAILSIAEEVMHNGSLITPAPTSPERSSGLIEPTIDDFTRHLGIGWSLISANEDIQAAARGWTKYIENHYPVSNANIRLQSKGLASYLVETNEGYFLFSEDLKQGRLVSTILERVWENLRGPQPAFDGEVIMTAGDSPKANSEVESMSITTQDSVAAPAQQTINEVDMDLS